MTADTAREAEIRGHEMGLRTRGLGDDQSDCAVLLRLLDKARNPLRAVPDTHLSEAEIEARAYFEAYRGAVDSKFQYADVLIAALDKAQATIGELEEMVSDCEEARDNARMENERLRAAPDAPEAEVKTVWLKAKPGHDAQGIRADMSLEFADDAFPDYVWDLIDIAAQRGIDLRAAPDASDQQQNTPAEIALDILLPISHNNEIVAGVNSVELLHKIRDAIAKDRADVIDRALSPTAKEPTP